MNSLVGRDIAMTTSSGPTANILIGDRKSINNSPLRALTDGVGVLTLGKSGNPNKYRNAADRYKAEVNMIT